MSNLTTARKLIAGCQHQLQELDEALAALDSAEASGDPVLLPTSTAALLLKIDRLHDRIGRLAERVLPHLDVVTHEHDGAGKADER